MHSQHHDHILKSHDEERRILLEEILRMGEIDCAGMLLPTSEEFDSQPVRREPLVALLHASHPLSANPAVSLAELRDTPFIIFETGFSLHRRILDASRRAGFEPSVVARSSQIDFMVGLVAAGLGVAFLPRMIASQRAHPAVRLVLLEEITRMGNYYTPYHQPRQVRAFGDSEDYLYAVDVSSDGKLVASGGEAGVIYLYDAVKGELIRKLPATR